MLFSSLDFTKVVLGGRGGFTSLWVRKGSIHLWFYLLFSSFFHVSYFCSSFFSFAKDLQVVCGVFPRRRAGFKVCFCSRGFTNVVCFWEQKFFTKCTYLLLFCCVFVFLLNFHIFIESRIGCPIFSIFGTVLRCSIFISFFRNIFCFIFWDFFVQNSVFTQPRMYFKATTISMFDRNEDTNITKIFALEVFFFAQKKSSKAWRSHTSTN